MAEKRKKKVPLNLISIWSSSGILTGIFTLISLSRDSGLFNNVYQPPVLSLLWAFVSPALPTANYK